jgi:hypothetical protein
MKDLTCVGNAEGSDIKAKWLERGKEGKRLP